MALDGNRTGPFTRQQARGKAGAAREERRRPHLERTARELEAARRRPRDRRARFAGGARRTATAAVAGSAPPADAAADAAAGRAGGTADGRTARQADAARAAVAARRTRPTAWPRDRSCRRRAAFTRRWPPGAPSTAAAIRHRCWRRRRRSRTCCTPHAAGAKTNGVGIGHAPPRGRSTRTSCRCSTCRAATQTAPGAPPRLMSVARRWPAGPERRRRRRRAAAARVYILGLLGVIGVVVVARRRQSVEEAAAAGRDGRRSRRRDRAGRRRREAVASEPPPAVAPDPAAARPTRRQGKAAAARHADGRAATPAPTTTTVANTRAGAPGGGDAARFRDNHNLNITGGGVASRPPPAQGDITQGDQQQPRRHQGLLPARAHARQQPHARQAGREAVDRDLGTRQARRPRRTGAVRLLLEPCIKEVVSRWVFPQASEEYGTEFPLVFQGNE